MRYTNSDGAGKQAVKAHYRVAWGRRPFATIRNGSGGWVAGDFTAIVAQVIDKVGWRKS